MALLDVRSIRAVPASPAVLGVLVASDAIADTGWDRRALKRLGFEAKANQRVELLNDRGAVEVLVGIGPLGEAGEGVLRSAAATLARSVARHRTVVLDASAVCSGDGFPVDASALAAITEGLILGAYRYDDQKSAPGDSKLERVNVFGTGDRADSEAIAKGVIVAGAQCLARDLVNEPGGSLTPEVFADRAAAEATARGIAVEVLGPDEIEAQGMGGVMAVNRGSEEEPRFVTMRYRPKGATRHLAFVGKGITFDSGGLSIKPADGMMTMKCDMGGAAAVIAAVLAIADLGLRVDVTVFTPMTDNMTGGDATRPGDVFRARNGTTVEVLNTDAEGRLILADALDAATEAAPDLIVDLATLTGACVVALGEKIAGVLANGDEAADAVLAAALDAGERMWRLPMPADYSKMLDSDVADLKNIGSRWGGTITAALFLQRFVGADIPWAHIDIAGPAFADSADAEVAKGGTGFGVRTLVALAAANEAAPGEPSAAHTADDPTSDGSSGDGGDGEVD